MYTYYGARVKEKGSRGRWKSKDVSKTTFTDLLREYQRVVLELNHRLYDETLGVDIAQIPQRLISPTSTSTVEAFLESIGNASLPLLDELPPLDVVYANFLDANQADFLIKPVNTIFHHEVPLPKEDQYDLRLTHPKVDPKTLFDTSIMTVNGLFHRTNYTGDSVNILEGAINGRHADLYQVGIYHLGQLGNVQTVPIRTRHVHHAGKEQPLGERAIIEIDERVDNLENKTVLVVIGGYLHVPGEGVVKRVGLGQYGIDFKDYPLAQRFFEMDSLLDLHRVKRHLDTSTNNPDQIHVETLYSDNVIQEILQLSQSFFVVIDTPEVFLDIETAEFNGLSGSYITHEQPRYPLVTSNGRFREYWARKELDRFVLTIDDGLRPNYLFETVHWKERNSIDPSRVPFRLNEFTHAYFWKLGKYIHKK